MAGKGAPAAVAAPAAATSNGGGPIPVVPAAPPMMGDKTIPQVAQETTDLIAETMAEIANDPDPWGAYNANQDAADKAAGKGKRGKDGKFRKEEAKDADAEGTGDEEESASDDAEADSDDGETDAGEDDGEASDEDAEGEEDDSEGEEDEAEGKDGKSFAGKRRALKRQEKRIAALDATVKAEAAQNEKDATLLNSLFGDAITALNGARVGDQQSTRAAVEAVLTKYTGLTLDEAIVFLVDPSKAPSAADLKLRKLEKERADERAAAAKQGEDATKAKATQDATDWITNELKTDPATKKLLKLPGFVASALQAMVDGYQSGVTTPKKAAAKVIEALKSQRKLLNEAFGSAKDADEEDEPEAKSRNGAGKRGRGSPPRQGVTRNASQNGRPMTTGDAIIDTLLEEGMIKSTDPRVLALKGKKVGVA